MCKLAPKGCIDLRCGKVVYQRDDAHRFAHGMQIAHGMHIDERQNSDGNAT